MSILIRVYKMENNYETLRMPELKVLTREHRLRNYSWLRKADLIASFKNNEQRQQRPPSPPPQMYPSRAPPRGATWEPNRPPQMPTWKPNRPTQMSTWEPEQPELEVPLPKRQLKRRRNKDSKLAKKFKSLDVEIGNLKSQMEELENNITKASESTNARFKRKKNQVHEKRG